MHVVFCIPTITKPHQATLDALEASLPLLDEAGIQHSLVNEIGCPYISHARATMLRKALDAGADQIVFLDHDVSWRPVDMLALIQTEGDFVAGTYRFKRDEEEYMGALLPDIDGYPQVNDDGSLRAHSVPAGFLKVTNTMVARFMNGYPDLCYGPKYHLSVDLFNHGAHQGMWYGEDYALCRNWRDIGGEIKVIPGLQINHHSGSVVYPGNFHLYLGRQPGGALNTDK